MRQNSLSEGKTGKYLNYAIGEIMLVVIGILNALNIKNKIVLKTKNIADFSIS
uniref:hypothetical protein n=1 Tax=Gelidibacter sp. TaxID=2018083 RepID=UPI00404B306E